MSASYTVRLIAKGEAHVSERQFHAASESALRAELEAGGTRVLRVAVEATGRSTRRRAAVRSGLDVAWWCKELATLLRAGMTAVEAIDTVRLQAGGGLRADVQHELLRSLQEGKALSRAMQDGGRFPAVLVASVAASERTSTLADALDDYLRYDAQMQTLRRQAVGAAIYPAVVLGFGALIALFLLVYVIPRFGQMYTTFRGAVSGPTQIMMWVSAALTQHLPLVLAGLGATAALLAAAWFSGGLRQLASWAVDHLPGLRGAARDFRLAQLYQALALTLRGGYSLVEALQVCEALGLGPRITTALTAGRMAIERGQPASRALNEAGLADLVAQRLLGVGERTGQFAQVLQTLAARHGDAFALFMQRATRLLEPILLLGVAVVVGGIVVLMYMPIFDIANGLR
jgi:general secretion pathway protein F